jgi:arylformamidase
MKISLIYSSKTYEADLSAPLDISIPLRNGTENPSCYYADPATFETISAGSFIGSVKLGGSVNHKKVTLTPHGNGTHTECYGHISADESATINKCLTTFHAIAALITCRPIVMANGDSVISVKDVKALLTSTPPPAVIIRSLPNEDDKRLRDYSGTNPVYLEGALLAYLASQHVEHLVIDLPSVDREVDGGKLEGHKAFWNMEGHPRKHCTITELAFIPNSLRDGLYLLNLQIPSFELDAAPSKPVLYKLTEVPTFSEQK